MNEASAMVQSVSDLQERQWHFALATLESMTVCESLQPNLITCSATAEAPELS